jgi:hypothetical protein
MALAQMTTASNKVMQKRVSWQEAQNGKAILPSTSQTFPNSQRRIADLDLSAAKLARRRVYYVCQTKVILTRDMWELQSSRPLSLLQSSRLRPFRASKRPLDAQELWRCRSRLATVAVKMDGIREHRPLASFVGSNQCPQLDPRHELRSA